MKIEEAEGHMRAESNLGVVINHHKLALTQHLPLKGPRYRNWMQLKPLLPRDSLEA